MRVGIIGAMEEEVEVLLNLMTGVKSYKKGGSTKYHGVLNGVDVVLLQSGIGKVAASIGTTLLIDQFNPDYIINTGSAGGMSPDLEVGDIVISDEVRYHDVDVTLFGYKYGQLPGLPEGFTPDTKLVDIAERASKKVQGLSIKHGLIITGDSFIHNEEHVEKIKSNLPKMEATEMEAGAIAQVCYKFGVPFVVIRAISDVPGKESKQSFEDFLKVAAKNSSNLVLKMLEIIKEENNG